MRRLRLLLVIAIAFVVVSACVARRVGLSRDALERTFETPAAERLPTVQELLTWRVPVVPEAPKELVGSPAAQAFARGVGVEPAADDDADDALACLRADVRRDYPAIVKRCLAFVRARPQDARAPAAVRLLARHIGSLSDDARQLFLDGTGDVVAGCAAARATPGALSCADLALVLDEARRAAAVDDATRLRLAAQPLYVTSGTAEGPYFDADESFATSPFVKAPLRKHGRFRFLDVVDRSESGAGTLVPSHRGIDGWWRVTVRGETKGAKDVVLAVRASGPMEIHVDGRSVMVREHDVVGADLERLPLSLKAGLHSIEVLSFERGAGVRIAVVDADGKPALAPVPRQKWGRTAGFTPRDDYDGVVQALPLPPTVNGDDADQLATMIFRHVLARAGHGQTVDDERDLARALIANFGWSTPALAIAAQTVEDDALPERFSAGLAAPLWDRVLAAWPDHPVALLSRARLAAVANPEGALPAWRAVVAARPDYAIGHRELIDALLDRDIVDEALSSAETLLKLGETADNVDAAVPALRAAGQMTRAAALMDKQARRSVEQSSRRTLARGDTATALGELQRRVADDDDDALTRWLDLSELARPADAIKAIDKAIARHPDDNRLRLRRARLAMLNGGTIAPMNTTVDLEALLWREAMGAPVPWSSRRQQGDDVVAARRRSQEPWPGFATVFLQDDLERRFAPDGTSLVTRHWIAELRSKEALDGFGELRPSSGERLLRLRVVKADGRIVEAEHHDNVDDISLPQLSIGDIVEWLSVSADGALTGGGFWELRSLVQSTPAVTRRYTVTIPTSLAERMPIELVHKNGAPGPVQTKDVVDGVESTTSVFEMAGEPLLDEPFTTEREEVEPQAGVVVNVDDQFFRRSRRGDLGERARVDPWLKRAALEIAGRGTGDDKLARVFRFVATAITPQNSPGDAISVLATGSGQRLPLFVALATAAGLEVHVLAAHAPLAVPLTTPHRTSYGSILCSVVVDGMAHVAWFNDDAAILDRLPQTFAGSHTLDLHTGARGVLSDRVIDTAPTTLTLDLALGDDDVVRGFMALRLPAAVAEAVRPSLRQATDAQLGQMLEAALASSLPGVKVARVTLPGLESAAGPLAFVGDVEVPVASSGTVRFEHLFPGGAAAAFQAATPLPSLVRVAERKRPLRVLPESENLVVRLRLPARASFVELPESVDLVAGPVRLKQTASVEDGALLWERSIERQGARVGVDEWPAVRAALAPLLSRADARVAFVAALPTSSGVKAAAAEQTR
ncbi:MAG: hypothetical protein Q8O67_02250 [Deltaproteobacteria bacterium]|nr:hypothetical protein [Deltaproteobacteria bacterium]